MEKPAPGKGCIDMARKRRTSALLPAIAWTIAVLSILPVVIIVGYSFNSAASLDSAGMMMINSLNQYKRLLIDQIAFVRLFFNSIGYAVSIIIGQILISLTSAFALSRYRFRISTPISLVYFLLMLLPFQITMVPSFIAIRTLGLLNTPASIILPAIFTPFSVLMLRQYMLTLPPQLIEAAVVDGANDLRIFMQIIIPTSKSVIAIVIALILADAWNMVEQPLILLQDSRLFPLSLAMIMDRCVAGAEFAGAALFMLPVLLVFLYFSNDFKSGIHFGSIK
jgi:multiple sugar transport system permease protein